MPIVLQKIRGELSASSPAAYWQTDWQNRLFEWLAGQQNAESMIGLTLVQVYGPAAANSPAFRQVFRPLEATHPFLNSDDQQAVRALRLKQQQHALAQSKRLTGAPSSNASGGPRPLIEATDPVADLARVLPPDAAFEVAVRDSPLANRLRAADANLNEDEFRVLFKAMTESLRLRKPLALQDIKSVPKDKALRVIASTDPGYAAMQVLAQQRGVNPAQLLSVYEVVHDTNESLSRLTDAGPMNAIAAKQVADVVHERDRQVAEIAGEKTGAELMVALGNAYQSLAPNQHN